MKKFILRQIYLVCLWGSVSGNLCTARGVNRAGICEDSPDACIVYKDILGIGKINGISVESGDEYCMAYGLFCLHQFDGNKGCTKGLEYKDCSESVGQNNGNFIIHCVATGKEQNYWSEHIYNRKT